jgi:hypothetical protein
MTINGMPKISFQDAENAECPITVAPIVHPAWALPCGHIFERTAIQGWMTCSSTCPLDRRQIESISTDPVFSAEKNEEKIKALVRLECSILVSSVATKNFIARADQIAIRHASMKTRDGTTEEIEFSGLPIDQLYTEYWKRPLPLPHNAHALITLRRDLSADGNCKGNSHQICIIAS